MQETQSMDLELLSEDVYDENGSDCSDFLLCEEYDERQRKLSPSAIQRERGTAAGTVNQTTTWTTGVRHLSLSSDTLNARMISRGKLFNTPQFVFAGNDRFHGSDARNFSQAPNQLQNIDSLKDAFYFGKNVDGKLRTWKKREVINAQKVFEKDVCYESVSYLPQQIKIQRDFSQKSGHQTCHTEDESRNEVIRGGHTSRLSELKSTHNSANNKSRDLKQCMNETQTQEAQRFKRQYLCDLLSLVLVVTAVVFIAVTPFLLIPIWVFPNKYSQTIAVIMWISIALSVLLLALAIFVGNAFWYFDSKTAKWKWFLHFGRGPQEYHWASALCFGKRENHSQNASNCITKL